MNSYNLCGSDLLTPALKKKCFSNDISVQDIVLDAMRSHPDVPFAFVQSKIDDIQQGFYIALGVGYPYSVSKACILGSNSLYVCCSTGNFELHEEVHRSCGVLCRVECNIWIV